MKSLGTHLLIFSVLLVTLSIEVTAQACKPSGTIRGRHQPPGCFSDCCVPGRLYYTYTCSPLVSSETKAVLTLNDFSTGGDFPSACDGKYHSDAETIVAISTGWYNRGERCHKNINIRANGHTVKALVVDECNSTTGCDKESYDQPPCANNIVAASKAVWKALGVNKDNWTELDITWSDA